MPPGEDRHTCRHERGTALDQSSSGGGGLPIDVEVLVLVDVDGEVEVLVPGSGGGVEVEELELPDDVDPPDAGDPPAAGPCAPVCCAGTVAEESFSAGTSTGAESPSAADSGERPRGVEVSPGART
jgi:hypothetical protein